MKKIVINRIEEYMDIYLNVSIDVISVLEGSEEEQSHYEYHIMKEKLDFYYIGNWWLPFTIDKAESYVLHIANKETIVKTDKFYTNMKDGMNLSDAVIIYGNDLKMNLLGKKEMGEIVIGERGRGLQVYLQKLFVFYEKVFRKKVDCSIYILDIDFQAVSFPNLVILNQAYLQRPNTYLYKFLPHELFHQVNGCFIKYSGIAREWMRESFVEYLQLLYLREALNETFYNSQLEVYEVMERKWCTCGVSIYDFKMMNNIKEYKHVIYGRGVMIFHKIFNGKIESVIKFVNILYLSSRVINIMEYLKILEKVMGIDQGKIKEELKRRSIEGTCY